MTTDQLTGRALDEAAARAMGAAIASDTGAFRLPPCEAEEKLSSLWRGFKSEPLTADELMAHLTKKGIVHTASSQFVCEVRFMSLPGMEFIPGDGERPSHVRGRDLREALARLVVAVAAREAKHG